MTDRPMIFSAPMVRALIEDRKTQTRRILKPQPEHDGKMWYLRNRHGGCFVETETEVRVFAADFCPWAVGDSLWVREAWRTFVSLDDVQPTSVLSPERGAGICYEAGGGASISRPPAREFFSDYSLEERHDRNAFGRLRPSIHMPRWASRLTLDITDVRRLQDISEDDAIAEGVLNTGSRDGEPWSHCEVPGVVPAIREADAAECYAQLWDRLHGDGGWNANHWVAVIEFKTALRNIDCLEKVDERVG